MSDTPRGPLDQQPDEPGWWLASDGKWYPPESAATQPVPTVPTQPTSQLPAVAAPAKRGLWSRYKGWPLWARISAPIALVFLLAGVAGAAGGSSKQSTAEPPVVTTTATAPETTTLAEPSTTRATTPPKTTPPKTTPPATSPPATSPPATSPPATSPPATSPPAVGNPGDTKNCSDFATYAQAKAWFDTYFPAYGDVAGLDADGDHIPCESLPGAP